MTGQTAIVSATFDAPAEKVWKALTDPAAIKQYFFGTHVETDWRVGRPIRFHGEYKGKTYEDKGEIREFTPEKRLAFTHWSTMSGVPDTPENYHLVTYVLEPVGNGTKLTVTQDKASKKEETEGNWRTVLDGLKKFLAE